MSVHASATKACDVLVAGAGPVGLFLALQLTARGRSVRVVELRSGQSQYSKALAIMPRTMEAFWAAGISAPFESAAMRVNGAAVMTKYDVLARIPIEPERTRFDYLAMVPQDVTERILLECLVAAGGAVEYDTKLVGLTETPDGARVLLETPRGEEECAARFVAGCDGAHSTVRRLIGMEFEGGEYENASFALFDIDVVGDAPTDDVVMFPNRAGPLVLFPIGPSRRRLVATLPRDFSREPTLDLANELIAERGPWNLGASKLHWASLFTIRDRQTPSMDKGSTFLAGDASHVHSPLGGQGMNTGLQDAFNLAWKLDYVLGGFATDGLLPSYTAERHRIAKDLIRTTTMLTRVMASTNAFVRGVRDYAIPRLSEIAALRRFIVGALTELSVNYAHSPIVDGSGRRALDEGIRSGDGERRLYDVIAGRYTLVYPAAAPAAVAAAFEEFVPRYGGAVRAVSSDDAGAPFVRLVRPDAYLALEAALPGPDPTPVIARLARVLATHVRESGTPR